MYNVLPDAKVLSVRSSLSSAAHPSDLRSNGTSAKPSAPTTTAPSQYDGCPAAAARAVRSATAASSCCTRRASSSSDCFSASSCASRSATSFSRC